MNFLLEVEAGNCQEVSKILKENPEEINLTDKNGNTSLHLACEKGIPEMIQILIKYGAKLDAQNKCPGWTAVHFAAYEGHEETLKLLLESGAQPNVEDWQGDTAESWALDWENYKCAMLLADATKKLKLEKDSCRLKGTTKDTQLWQREDHSNADTFDSDDDSDDDDDDDEELTHWVLPLPKTFLPAKTLNPNPSPMLRHEPIIFRACLSLV